MEGILSVLVFICQFRFCLNGTLIALILGDLDFDFLEVGLFS